jgi:hypothetical protein
MVLLILGCLVLFHAPLVAGEADAPRDVFPLHPGLRYTYAYFSCSSSADEIYSTSSSDSGVVRYAVIDSASSGDTSIVWRVMEARELWHTVKRCCAGIVDTSYWAIDTVTVYVHEGRAGRHELRCRGRVWNFPMTGLSTMAVFRYADTDLVELAMRWNGSFDGGSDSLWLSAASGLSGRKTRSSRLNGYTYLGYRCDARSLHDPVLSASGREPRPTALVLMQNYPNPFNPATIIRYRVPVAGTVRIVVYDMLGREVAVLVNERKDPGTFMIPFDAAGLASGAYVYRLTTGALVQSRTMMVVR